MSRIGKKIVVIPQGVTLERNGQSVVVRGSRGELTWELPSAVDMTVSDTSLAVTVKGNDRKVRALHGLSRQLLATMIIGVSEGYRKQLEMKGTGYRAEVQGSELVLSAGFSHQVRIPAPEGITFKVEKNVQISVEGNDKQVVGEVAAKIRSVRPPEPYKGKGIRYQGELVRLKPGKAVKASS